MKKRAIIVLLFYITSFIYAQDYHGMSDADYVKTQEHLQSLPNRIFQTTQERRTLPTQVDNSTSRYFRPIFNQINGCCAQAAFVAYHFTYLYNRILDTDASLSENQFPTHYTYNFSNGGSGDNGSVFSDAIDLISCNGIPTNKTYGTKIPRPNYWMNSYENYLQAMNCKVRNFTEWGLNLDSDSAINKLKCWLVDMDGQGSPGGLACFARSFSARTTKEMTSGSKAGEKIITKWAGTGHALTIVGYDDSILFDLNDDGKFTDDIDINGDDTIDFRDREWGAFKIANSWGNWFEDSGFTYAPYSLIGHTSLIEIQDTLYQSRGAIELQYSCDDRYYTKLLRGVSRTADKPDFIEEMRTFDGSQAGHHPLSGVVSTLEIGVDMTNQLEYEFAEDSLYLFLGIVSDSIGGTIEKALFHDYRCTNEEIILPLETPPTFAAGTTWVKFKVPNRKTESNIITDSLSVKFADTLSTKIEISGDDNYSNWYIDSLSYCECEADSVVPDPSNPNFSFEVWDFPAELSFRDTTVTFYGQEYSEFFIQNRGRGGIRFGKFGAMDTISVFEAGEEMLRSNRMLSIMDAIVTVQWDKCFYTYVGEIMKPSAIELKWNSHYLNLYGTSNGLEKNCNITVRARIHSSGKFELYYDKGNSYDTSSSSLPYTMPTTIGISDGAGRWQRHPLYSLDHLFDLTDSAAYSFAYEPAKLPDFCELSPQGQLKVASPITGNFSIPVVATNSKGLTIRKCLPLKVKKETAILSTQVPPTIRFHAVSKKLQLQNLTQGEKVTVSLFAPNGRVLSHFSQKSKTASMSIPLPALSTGVYLCQVQTGSKVFTEKIHVR